MNYLGIDWGTAKLGFATGSDELKISSPFLFFRYTDIAEAIEKIKELVKNEDIDSLVIGKPVSLNGDEAMSSTFNNFTKELESLGLPINFEDERMTTQMANKLSKEEVSKVEDDVVSAMLILQSFLDRNE